MMDMEKRFKLELESGHRYPMVNHCIKRAEEMVMKEHPALIIRFDSEVIGMHVEDMLYKAYKRAARLRHAPNGRWLIVESELNHHWFVKHSGHVKDSACSSPCLDA